MLRWDRVKPLTLLSRPSPGRAPPSLKKRGTMKVRQGAKAHFVAP